MVTEDLYFNIVYDINFINLEEFFDLGTRL